jgi:N-acetylglucosaminyl-diphospho-decaprenol L-rhamnosyltransferase
MLCGLFGASGSTVAWYVSDMGGTEEHCTVRRVIAAVVVTFDAPPGTLDRCLDALADEVDRIVVVDTGGRAEIGDRPHVDLVRVANDGYGAAANVGFDAALAGGASAVVLLNDDVVGRPGWVAPLVTALGGDRVGAAQPVLVVAGTDVVNSRGVQIGPDGAGTDIDDGRPHVPSPSVTPLELFTGGAVAFRPAFLRDTGGFDRRWFLYYEDVDLARRGSRLGWRYVLVGGAVVDHVRSVTTGRMPDRTRYLQERNRLRAAFRWASPATIVRALWLSVRRLRHEPRRVHARALAAALAAAPGELRRRLADP